MLGIGALSCPTEPLYPRPAQPAALTAPVSLWLPYLPLAIAGGLELVEFRNTLKSDPGFAVVNWLILAVLARQFLVVA